MERTTTKVKYLDRYVANPECRWCSQCQKNIGISTGAHLVLDQLTQKPKQPMIIICVDCIAGYKRKIRNEYYKSHRRSERTCPVCKDSFYATIKRKFCSTKCRVANHRSS